MLPEDETTVSSKVTTGSKETDGEGTKSNSDVAFL